jgi:hypothetical protein
MSRSLEPLAFNSLTSVQSLNKLDTEQVGKLISVRQEIAAYLSKKSADDPSYAVSTPVLQRYIKAMHRTSRRLQSAQELTGATWGYELSAAISACESKLDEAGENGANRSTLINILSRLKGAMLDNWRNATVDVFTVGCVSHPKLVRR